MRDKVNESNNTPYRHFFAEESVQRLPEFGSLQKRYPYLEQIEDYQKFRKEDITREKDCLIFAKKRGPWLKPFHCYDEPSYRYLSLDVAEGCFFDCAYCYLQSYLNHGALVIFLDLESLVVELDALPGDRFWISTGLLSDSLLAERSWPILPELSRRIPDGSVLELRSKSNDVSIMKDSSITRGPVVISWSLNPDRIAATYEYRAAPMSDRLSAAHQAIQYGYRVAFHFDPVFFYDTWKEDYSELFDTLNQFPVDRIAFLSVGLFRYMPDLGAVIRKRFPFHPILTGEFFPDEDGKYHYFRTIRKQMYNAFSEWIAPWKEKMPVFWSMEPDSRLVPK